MKATYKLKLEQHQRRLGLTHKQLNRYDRKHNDINLIKFLQSLEVVSSAPPAPPAPSGWYGELIIYNSYDHYGTLDIDVTVEADTNGTIVELNALDTITVGNYIYFTLSEENRLTSPSTLIKITFLVDEGGTISNIYPGTGINYESTISTATELYFTVDGGFLENIGLNVEVTTTG